MDGIRLKSVSARFRHQVKGEIAAVHDVSLDVAPGELMTLLGPSGLRQDHDLAHDRGLPGAERGRDLDRRARRHRHRGERAQHRLRVPELRAVPASLGVRERRLRAAGAAAWTRDEIRRAVDRRARAGRACLLRAADAASALRRRAAARRARARDRDQAARAAVRRAALEPRRQAAHVRCAAKSATCSAASASRRCMSRTIRKRRWRSRTASPS